MGLFDKLKEPVFYKETSDATKQLDELKEFLEDAPEEIKEQVEQDIKMLSYGISGENNVAFELKNSAMPMLILHDLHFEYESLSAQIDYLVITKKVIVVIECKNLIGNIEVNNNGDFIRTMEFGRKKKREGIYSPITQNQRHLEILKKIRRSDKSNIIAKAFFDRFFDDGYKSVVVLANPKTVINMKFAKKEVKEQIIKCDQLIEYIKKLNKESKNEQNSEKQMYELAESFLRHHTPNLTDYKEKYKANMVNKVDIDPIQNDSIQNDLIQNDKMVQEPKTQPQKELQENAISHSNSIVNENQVAEEKPYSQADMYIEKVTQIKTDVVENIENTPIYQELKQFRYNKSKDEKIKPYFIYNNAQMEELIKLMPKSIEEIKSVAGFGDTKCQKYGNDIMMIIEKNRYRNT